MELDAFICYNLDLIVTEWVTCAREVLPPAKKTEAVDELHSCGPPLLEEIARAMQAADKGTHRLTAENEPDHRDAIVEVSQDVISAYSASRHAAGFSTAQVIHELCLLRSIVSAMWRQVDSPVAAFEIIKEFDRFNQALDSTLRRSVQIHTTKVAASRDMFLAVLGHDLRGPLNGIEMASSVLLSPGIAESVRIETARRILRATKIMGGLIADLLDFTRTRLGVGLAIERSECNLREVCEEALEIVSMSAPQRAFMREFAGDLHAQVDRARIRQLLFNVLNNAVQHGDDKPISLIATGAEDTITLTISNFGKPIPEEAARIIFDPLIQVPATMAESGSRLKDSLGLGLFIAREIVLGHGGLIAVRSSLEDGTTFTIRLPRALA